ncbi:PREDICTED: FBD-associated F-box protein At4g10400-like isoform X1 [Camelina sativa]|uniref:FBD-associated F-box protein At4g10400-like isoform X1 n=1 Tax=Camelina sativa TaxID=90675 RepID=A0ABM0TJ99_CAMSA|nr:PREDICTED: FBD-associated F-box protein At4g10400-like isoform X1 [Camelina sativa]XP_010427223.1 PREDICTED: FBD-associated F-box protein At4g10400-like isoform X1 [Camelina sativa]XP_010427224.1 PREDICTED: FBD-associated F-box protein At4g10400-like isoform X1 [Camelina sativa]XP_010427225.1 PREDICTED: FBD-associated F-box protein At4g10400-like isoform X1 [Camelina sativa]
MDRISELSDELLIKILLFVPTKVAVSTSVLSKRWEYLWMWLPKLDYGGRHYSPSDCEMLQCFLDKNLPLHRAPVIESFRLDLSSRNFTTENIKLWVVIAAYHCVRKLEIIYESYPEKPNILPSNLYTCKSLVILKLKGTILLDVPRVAFLPSLKTMHLRSVRYHNDEESLQRLLSNCPVLKDLLVDLCEHDSMGKLTVVVPSLQSLSLYIPYNFDIGGIEIRTPFLKYFKLEDCSDKRHYCLVENMPNLIEADVDVDLHNIKSLIGSITSVKRLSICISSKDMYDEGFVFNQLEHLKICFGEFSSNLLVRLLNDSSNLQVLELHEMDNHCHDDTMVNWNQPSTVPECMLLSLQTLNWSDYSGTPGERDLAVYILKNAVHLKTMKITSFEGEVPKFEMIKELALSSRASTACQLVFHCLY